MEHNLKSALVPGRGDRGRGAGDGERSRGGDDGGGRQAVAGLPHRRLQGVVYWCTLSAQRAAGMTVRDGRQAVGEVPHAQLQGVGRRVGRYLASMSMLIYKYGNL
jgi:hypothetical protein